jgi:hypothetical protein
LDIRNWFEHKVWKRLLKWGRIDGASVVISVKDDYHIKPILSGSDCKKRYSDNAALNKGYVNLVLKSEVKKHNSAGVS